MKNILYIGKYNGIIGGIERYIESSSKLLQNNGFTVHYRYIEQGGKNQEDFSGSFASRKVFSENEISVSGNRCEKGEMIYNKEKKIYSLSHPSN